MESKGKILGMDITFIATINGTNAMGLHAMIALFQGITGQTVKRS
jgi:hypothetical protein